MMLALEDARQAWIELLASRGFTHAVTLKPNHRTERATESLLRSAFIRFHRDVDQALLGGRYHRPSRRHLRTEAVGIIEGLPVAGHIHAVFRVSSDRWTDFEALFRPLTFDMTVNPKRLNPWAARVIGGTSVVERMDDVRGWLSYSTKSFSNCDSADRIVFLPSDA